MFTSIHLVPANELVTITDIKELEDIVLVDKNKNHNFYISNEIYKKLLGAYWVEGEVEGIQNTENVVFEFIYNKLYVSNERHYDSVRSNQFWRQVTEMNFDNGCYEFYYEMQRKPEKNVFIIMHYEM